MPEEDNKYGNAPVFTAFNNHIADCGAPPGLTNRDVSNTYYGYFENCFGEQFVFLYDFAAEKGMLFSGDAGWEESFCVAEVSIDDYVAAYAKSTRRKRKSAPPAMDLDELRTVLASDEPAAKPYRLENGNLLAVGLLMANEEMAWLKSCWHVVTEFRHVRTAKRAAARKA